MADPQFNVNVLPEKGPLLVVLRSDTVILPLLELLGEKIRERNPNALLVVLRPEENIECMDEPQMLRLVAVLSDRLHKDDLRKIGLQRIIA